MNRTLKIYTLMSLLIIMITYDVYSQSKNVYEDMTLDEILDIDVLVTASKQPEDLFETPLSATIISKEEISRAGASSIMEALRLSQGVIVREITPGNYDVQIRGFETTTRSAYVGLPYNTTTLVMVDNRIVYDYFTGGTLWEMLTIDVNDIERIEIVRGPASALYGPNAATGVINIITSHANKKGLNVAAGAKIGNANTKIANANVGYNWNNKTKLSVTGNFTMRDRFDDLYYNWWESKYCTLDDMSMMLEFEKDTVNHEIWTYQEFSDSLNTYYDIGKSLEKIGGNLYFSHEFDEKSNIEVSFGTQQSQSQKTGFINFATPLTQYNSSSYYVDNKIKYHNIYGQWNITSGEVLGNSTNSFKYTNLDVILEYLFKYNDFSLRPGISFKYSNYNSPLTYDEPFNLSILNYEFKDQPRVFNCYSGSLLAEWRPYSKLRIIGGLRVDKFTINSNLFINYELASTYRFNKNNLFRIVFSHANRSPTFFDTYVNTRMNFYYAYHVFTNEKDIDVPIVQTIEAKPNQKYPTNTCIEASWRSKIGNSLELDTEIFYQYMDNLLVSNEYREIHSDVLLDSDNELDSVISGSGIASMYFENYDIEASQIGLSFMLKYSPISQIDIKVFGTFQKTFLHGDYKLDYHTIDTDMELDPETNILSIVSYSYVNTTMLSDKLTPAFYGGVDINYKPIKKININLNSYMYSKQVFTGTPFYNIISDFTEQYYSDDVTIDPFAIVNVKLSYELINSSNIFLSGNNLFGRHREFGYADEIGTVFLVGFQWNYNK